MKKVLIFILFIALPLVSVAQNTTSSKEVNATSISDVKKDTTDVKEKTVLRQSNKAQVIDLNYKKSFEIISIKAFRKSRHIKVKLVKMC
ncbi:hypothetical protein A9Q87_09630 [Flavobacteriales bacterium 34_180_T64]|nr:hypothetical protein A9Q87_09630 [Flavobacteriales bacterium 34_180_T64]